MADFDKNRIAKMQQYLTDVTDPEFKGSATDKNVAMAELFNYYHSDWKADASHFVDQNLELFDDEKMQMLFRNSNAGTQIPHIPSSDKSQKVSIRDQCDRGKSKDTRPSAQKWNVGPEHRKERATFCGCFGKRTPFLRGRVQLH